MGPNQPNDHQHVQRLRRKLKRILLQLPKQQILPLTQTKHSWIRISREYVDFLIHNLLRK